MTGSSCRACPRGTLSMMRLGVELGQEGERGTREQRHRCMNHVATFDAGEGGENGSIFPRPKRKIC